MYSGHLLRPLLALTVGLLALAPSGTHAAPSAAGTWRVTGSMHQARGNQTATLLANGQVLAAGGYDTNGFISSAELYDPHTGKWTVTGSMHQARGQFTATLLRDGRVLVTGGCVADSGNCSVLTADAELYDPRTGTWAPTGSMHEPRWTHTATRLPDGRVLVAGGAAADCYNVSCSGVQASAELYDPHTGAWTLTGPMHQARARHIAALLPDGRVLVAGGIVDTAAGGTTFKPLASAELYDPSTGAWTPTGSLHTVASGQSATLLSSGLVLTSGGSGPNGNSRAAQLYHPHTGSWATTGSLLHDTGSQATVLLRSGKVLAMGGSRIGVASAELYDPDTGAWTPTGFLHAFRIGQPMTLLAGGQVLVSGANSDILGKALASAELYNP